MKQKEEQSEMKDIRVDIKVRNNLILAKMEELSIESISELCRQMGNKNLQADVGRIINMKVSPLSEKGQWISIAQKISDFFKCLPEDLFSSAQLEFELKSNESFIALSSQDVSLMLGYQEVISPQALLEAGEIKRAINSVLDGLNSRHCYIIRRRFGIGCKSGTLDEVAEEFNVSVERIRQIETKALKALRQWKSIVKLKDFRRDNEVAIALKACVTP